MDEASSGPPSQPSAHGRGRRLLDYLTEPLSMRSSVPSMITLKILGIGLGIVSSVIIARALGPSDKGIYNLVVLVAVLFATFFNFGVHNGVFFYIARREMSVATGYTSILVTVCLGTFIAAPLVVIVGPRIANGFFDTVPSPWLALGLLLLAPLMLHSYMTQQVLLGTNRAVALYALPLLLQAITVGGALIFVVLMGGGIGTMIIIAITASALTQIATIAILRRGGTRLLTRPSTQPIVRAFRFGSLIWASSLLAVLLHRIDQLMIVHRSGASQLGQYALAVAIGEVLWSIDVPLTTAMRYRVAAGTGAEASDLVGRMSRLVIIVMVLACGTMALIAGWLIPFVYSEAYRPAVPALIAYLPAAFFLSLSRVVGEDIGYQRGRTDLVLLTNGVSLIVNVVLLFVLLPPFGIVGASLASVGAYFTTFAMNAVIHTRLAGTRLREILIPGPADVRTLVELIKEYATTARRRLRRQGSL